MMGNALLITERQAHVLSILTTVTFLTLFYTLDNMLAILSHA